MSQPGACSRVARVGALLLGCAACSLIAPGEEILGSGACDANEKLCDGRCASVHSPEVGCGSTGCTPCSFTHAAAACVGAKCHLATCELGFGDCNSAASDGCETDLRSDAAHCGKCGISCGIPHAVAACVAGRCVQTGCAAGRQECDGDPLTVCETDVLSDAKHCGKCHRVCALPWAAETQCVGGSCTIVACTPGRSSCNASAEDGCEVETRSDEKHCGKCDNPCAPTEVCEEGQCRKRCPAIRALHPNARLSVQPTGFGTGTGDFTVELWYARSAGEPAREGVITMNEAFSTNAVRVHVGAEQVSCLVYATAGTAHVLAPAPEPETWTHLACVRQSGVLRLFVAGALAASAPVSASVLELSPTAIGAPLFAGDGAAPMKLGPLRFSKVARYGAPFFPTAAWVVDGDTVAQFLTQSAFVPGPAPLVDEAGGDNAVSDYGGFEPALSDVPCGQ